MVDRLKVETKKAKSVLGSKYKFQLLERPDGSMYLSTYCPEKHCMFERSISEEEREGIILC